MPDILHEIGLFQFENLVRNRIPFALLNIDECDLTGLFPSYLQSHLESHEIKTTAPDAVTVVKDRVLGPDHAIVVLCEDGQKSGRIVDALVEIGFRNVYFVKGGRRVLSATN